jgi:microcystin-dependent protein
MEDSIMANFSSLCNNNHILVGSIIAVSVDSVPYGFLECNGAEISRDTYANLYSVIGDTYGAGDDSTTFNIPDLRGEFLRGWDNGRGVDANRDIGTLQSDDFKNHSHTITTSHSQAGGTAVAIGWSDGELSGPYTDRNGDDGAKATGGSETRPRNIAIMYCIKY